MTNFNITVFLCLVFVLILDKSGVKSFMAGMGRGRAGLGVGMGGYGRGVGLPGMGSRVGVMAGGGRVGRVGTVNSMASENSMAHFPPGVKMIDGELMDITNKVIQKAGTVGSGTQYFSYMNPRGPPIFRRKEIDTGRHFIVFPDANYMPGDGHYIVLRKVRGLSTGQEGGPLYEAYYLDLGDSINALVSNWDSLTYEPNLAKGGMRNRVKMRGRAN